ncbi:MAG: hypothetical protein DMF81_04885 [Acidobacteria bacterium]|nr:MAG: hypothetical protein DMF81_04885 [Acidobacteriota bacterium]
MLQLAAVTLVYAGGLVTLLGLACLVKPPRALGVRGRRTAALLAGGGVLGALAGFALPASLVRVAVNRTRLDAVVPVYQFHEIHSVRVQASPEVVLDAVRRVTAGEIRLFRTLTWIRSPRFGRGGRESILNAPEGQPILEVALRSGFVSLGGEPGREVVFGTAMRLAPARPDEAERIARAVHAVRQDPRAFAGLNAPGYAMTAMNFLVEAEPGGGCRLSTETRVFATDAATRRLFAVYWRVIYPGSSLIRRMWLQAVKRRVEGSAA